VPEEPADGDNVIDFEPAAAPAEEEGGMELDLSGDAPAEPPQEDAGLSLDMGSDEDDSSGLELSLADDEEAPAEAPAEGGIELDLSTDEAEPDSGGLELELDAGDGNPAEADLEGTVEIPKIELELDVGDDEDDDDDDDQRTVFVPRSTDAEEQSAEDEMATKLDLAKAYVELGDKESAKSILDEVISGGTDKQRQKAQELISQIS
jgi:pilus assembly protein FimV